MLFKALFCPLYYNLSRVKGTSVQSLEPVLPVEDLLIVLIGLFILGAVTVGANYADRYRSARARGAVVVALILVNILLLANGALQVVAAYGTSTSDIDPPDKANAWGALIVSGLTAGLATLMLFRPVAEKLAVLFPRFQGKRKTPPGDPSASSPIPSETPVPVTPIFPQMLDYYTMDSVALAQEAGMSRGSKPDDGSGQARGFNPASMVHVLALIFCLYVLGTQFVSFILEGGLEGVAETYEEEGVSGWDLLLNSLPFVVISFLGVGLGLRRNWSQTLNRLGLGLPTGQGVLVSLGVTIGLFIFVVMVALLWIAVVPEDVYEEQTKASDALSDSISTVWLALLLAATAAVGEEIAFRGALQPVLGFWPTAIIFALTHIQYTLTPAWLIILGVALAFGWIRQRFNTTTAILTHFLYNFIPLALALYFPEEEAWLHILRLL
jgi:membrane protease YdiL (CAAX protease family)